MEKRMRMRIGLRILAVLMMGMGIVWILQGVNILPGSFMTGQMVWAYRGAAVALAGVVIFLFTLRRGKRG
jgi:hypothetical protein